MIEIYDFWSFWILFGLSVALVILLEIESRLHLRTQRERDDFKCGKKLCEEQRNLVCNMLSTKFKERHPDFPCPNWVELARSTFVDKEGKGFDLDLILHRGEKQC